MAISGTRFDLAHWPCHNIGTVQFGIATTWKGQTMERIARMIKFVIQYHEDHYSRGMDSYFLIEQGCDACVDATKQERDLVFLFVSVAWNDAQEWAKQVLS